MRDQTITKTDPTVKVWLIIPDEYGTKYPYPLRDAKFCPVCGGPVPNRCEGKEISHKTSDGEYHGITTA